MSDNLKNYGTFIPGLSARPTDRRLSGKVMVRITYVGAGFLAIVAIFPTLVSSWIGVKYGVASFYGGTSLLIAVSVVFDLVQKIDSHLVMRNYRGLLEKILAGTPCESSSSARPARAKAPRPSAWSRPTGWPTCPPATCFAPPAMPRPKSA